MIYCSLDFFFFKQKTAYEMRISDWSSDVCSSDLYDIERRREIAASEAGWSRDIWREMAELGLLAAAIPAEAGGFAEGLAEALVVMEEFGRRLVVEPFSAHALVSGTFLAKLVTPAQRTDLLPPLLAADCLSALAQKER